jgi:hypothetical protein
VRRVAGVVLAVTLLAVIVTMVLRRVPAPETRRTSQAVLTDPVSSEIQKQSPPAPSESSGLPGAGLPFLSEDDYLRELERLNRTDKRRALELVEKGDAWYPVSGVRAEARKAMGITLLVDLGQMQEARVRTRRFIAEHPTSAYRPLVQGVTGIHPRPSGPNQEIR